MMKQRVMLIIILGFSWLVPVPAQQTQNLEVIWCRHAQRGGATSPGWRLLGCGDINNDGFGDFAMTEESHWDTIPSRVYLFYGGDPPDTMPDLTFQDDTIMDLFGSGLASGLFNTDAFPDLAISNEPRKVNIYFGGPGMDTTADFVIYRPVGGAEFGEALTSSDVNGDGWDDLVVGDYWGEDAKGAVFIYYGGPLLDGVPDIILKGHSPETFGHSVGGGGDVNGDGFEDVAVGAPERSGGGMVTIFYGGNPMDTIPDIWQGGQGSGGLLGNWGVVITRGSLNNDRFSEGCWGTPAYQVYRGIVYILHGGDPMDSIPDVTIHGRYDTTDFSYSIAEGGRVTGGPYTSVWVGAITSTAPSGRWVGAAYLFLGGANMDTIPDGIIYGRCRSDAMGGVVAGAGDINNDGKDEVMVSNYFGTGDSTRAVWVLRYTGVGVEERKEDTRSLIRDTRLRILQNPTTKAKGIRLLAISHSPHAKLQIYDVAGKLVESFALNPMPSAPCPITLHLNPGVYFVRLETEAAMVTKKVVVVE